MIPRYRLLAERLRTELRAIEQVVERAENAIRKAHEQAQDRVFFAASAALDLHGFYAGVERLFEMIASDVDQNRPTGGNWHRDLLAQMALTVADVRPAVIADETRTALTEYLEFRHVVRNVYTFNLRPERVMELVGRLRATFDLAQRDLLKFAEFLDGLATADEEAE